MVGEICDGICSNLNEYRLSSLNELIGLRARGFNPYPEAFRRQDYTSAVTELTLSNRETVD